MSDVALPVSNGAIDSEAMFAVTADLPEYLDAGRHAARGLAGLPSAEGIGAVVVCGMGGSGVAGQVLAALAAHEFGVPVVLTDSYELPTFVGPSTLVFANSFSGNTEETLATTEEAHRRGARLVAITGGGALGEFAESRGIPCYDLPDTIPQPRAALGAMVAPLLVCCGELGLLRGVDGAIDAAVTQLRSRRTELIASDGGIAGEITRRIGRTIPLIYGASGIGAVAARRWKTQVNENAKAPAFFASQPELCHNEVCGFGQSGDVTRQVTSLVFLRNSFEHARIAPRFDIVGEWLRETVADIIEFEAEGNGPLAELFDLVFVGDFVSLHLAVKEGIDPGPVPVLVELKAALARNGPSR